MTPDVKHQSTLATLLFNVAECHGISPPNIESYVTAVDKKLRVIHSELLPSSKVLPLLLLQHRQDHLGL
jgi:hypothetical protein